MQSIMARKVASLTELRDPAKVLRESGHNPIAIMNRNTCVGYFIPVEAVEKYSFEFATDEEIAVAMEKSLLKTRPGINYLRDK